MTDPILDELRAARNEIAEKFNFDLQAIGEDAMRRQGADGRKVVAFPPKPVPTWAAPPKLDIPGELPRGTVES